MRIWTPANQPCHDNGYLQTAADARARRNRFRFNPLAKVAGLFVPQPLRAVAAARRRCCCDTTPDGVYVDCANQYLPSTYTVTIGGFTGECACANGTFDIPFSYQTVVPMPPETWMYSVWALWFGSDCDPAWRGYMGLAVVCTWNVFSLLWDCHGWGFGIDEGPADEPMDDIATFLVFSRTSCKPTATNAPLTLQTSRCYGSAPYFSIVTD